MACGIGLFGFGESYARRLARHPHGTRAARRPAERSTDRAEGPTIDPMFRPRRFAHAWAAAALIALLIVPVVALSAPGGRVSGHAAPDQVIGAVSSPDPSLAPTDVPPAPVGESVAA